MCVCVCVCARVCPHAHTLPIWCFSGQRVIRCLISLLKSGEDGFQSWSLHLIFLILYNRDLRFLGRQQKQYQRQRWLMICRSLGVLGPLQGQYHNMIKEWHQLNSHQPSLSCSHSRNGASFT